MKRKLSFTVFILTSMFLSAIYCFAQNSEAENKQVNFRYSQNPKIRNKSGQPSNSDSQNTVPKSNEPIKAVSANNVEPETNETVNPAENPSIAKKTLEIAKRANTAALAPTEIYKVGLGDVLFISLQNASKASYYTVLNDGTLDYPLSGEMLPVAGMTTDEIEDLLKEKIKIYENPQISVKVRDYASHSISVLGLAEKTGERKIQREAVPLFVIKADAVVQPKATQAVVRRANSTIETLDLKDSKTDDVLIFPGDIVEFGTGEKAETGKANQFYYIGGEINSGGQKEYHQGITLTQAILASGGLRKTSVRKVVVRRKNAGGMLVAAEYNLKEIKDGRIADPLLQIDDTIEIGQ